MKTEKVENKTELYFDYHVYKYCVYNLNFKQKIMNFFSRIFHFVQGKSRLVYFIRRK